MEFVDSAGTRYQLTETAEAPAPVKKAPVWPWLVGGLVVTGGLVWMASSTSRKPNPMAPEIEALIDEARDPGTSRDRLWSLLNHPDVEVRRAILDNPNFCPTKANGNLDTLLLEELAKEFPEEVATHPLFVLHALIEPNDEMSVVVSTLVERTKDVGLIERILSTWGTSSENVRRSVAGNPNTPIDVLRLLGNEKTEINGYVRVAVAENPSTPEDLWRSLGNKATESDWGVRRAVAKNPNAPVDILRTLGNQQNEAWNVRKMVASNPSAPEDVLRILGNQETEPDGDVREAVASNPNTPEDVLRILGNPKTESRSRVRRGVAQNPSTPEDLLRSLSNPKTESEELVRHAVAWNPNTPVDVLLTLGNSKTESDWRVRRAVAQNPSTPDHMLRIMYDPGMEPHSSVRELAQKSLAKRNDL